MSAGGGGLAGSSGGTPAVVKTTGALPAASVAYEGQVWIILGGTGVPDALYICMKNTADAYVWLKWRDGDGGEFLTSETGL